MKRFLSVFLFFVSLLPFVSPAQEFEDDYLEVDSASSSLELDPAAMLAVTNLARSISGVNATQATVDDNVASILAILQALNVGATGSKSFRTLPYAMNNGNLTLGQTLAAFLGGSTSSAPTIANTHFDKGFLYLISQALSKGVAPSSGHDVLSILSRFESRSSSDSTILSNLAERVSLDSTYLSNLAHRVSQVLVDRLDDFLERSDENHFRLPESVYYISQDSDHIRATVDDLFSFLQTRLDITLGSLASYLSSIDAGINGIDSQLQSALNASLSDLETILRDVSSYAGDIYSYLGDQEEILQAISDHTDDTATGVAAIMNWFQYSFDSVLVEALADVTLGVDWSGHPDHFVVTVDNMPSNMMANTEAYLSNLVGQAKIQGSNVQDIASTVLEWYPIATNFYASATATRDQLEYAAFETNSIFTNFVAESDLYESQTNDFVAPDFDSVYTQTDQSVPNPWDGGDVAAVNVGTEAEAFFDPGTPDFNTEVVLMGSNEMNLPRIAFSVESVFGASEEARRWGAVMRGLWFFIGFALRFYMVGTWIIWFTQLEK